MQGRDQMTKIQLLKRRLRAVPMFERGDCHYEIADALGVERSTVTRWYGRYMRGGVNALKAKPDKGKPPRLTPEQVAITTHYLRDQRLSLTQIGEWIRDKWGVRLGKTRLWTLARLHGWAHYARGE